METPLVNALNFGVKKQLFFDVFRRVTLGGQVTAEQMEARIKEAFPEGDVVVFDLTGGQDHFEVRIATPQFAGKSRIQQHQEVMKLFNEELKTGEVHALAIKTLVKD